MSTGPQNSYRRHELLMRRTREVLRAVQQTWVLIVVCRVSVLCPQSDC